MSLTRLPQAGSQIKAALHPPIAHGDRMLQGVLHITEIVLEHFDLGELIQNSLQNGHARYFQQVGHALLRVAGLKFRLLPYVVIRVLSSLNSIQNLVYWTSVQFFKVLY